MKNIRDIEGKVLIATNVVPKDSIFHKSVIYITTVDVEAQLVSGIILNGRIGISRARALSEEVKWPDPNQMFHGGPTNTHVAYVIHDDGYHQAYTQNLVPGLAYTFNSSIISDIQSGIGPHTFGLFLGTCNWSPDALMNEITGDNNTGSIFWTVGDHALEDFMPVVSKEVAWHNAIDRNAGIFVNQLLTGVDENGN